MKRASLLAAMLAAASPALADIEDPGTDYALTIYSRAQPGAVDPSLYRPGGSGDRFQSGSVPGYAVVRQTQNVELDHGVSILRVRDVASLIDPTTVSMRSLRDENGVRVLEQSFEFDLVSSAKLLQRYLDREITLTRRAGEEPAVITGDLLSADGALVLRQTDGSVWISHDYAGIKLPELPGGLITRPTLVWSVHSEGSGTTPLRISYETEGMTWWADYNATLEENANDRACSLDLGAWVSIVNQSGAGFPDTRLKLIAGDVQRTPDPQRRLRVEALAAETRQDTGFQEKSFFEYHLYTLPRRTSLPNNSTKQLELFPAARGVPCTREYVYDGRGYYAGNQSKPVLDRHAGISGRSDVAVFLSFRNDASSGLGMPLPAGRLRVNKLDTADESLEFIGEDVIDHTPRDEDLRVHLGNAFDIVAERRQADYHVDTAARTLREAFEIELRNHKSTPVTVQVYESLYRWVNWEIEKSSHDYEKLDARSVRFPVRVEADGEATLRYEVRYGW